MQKISNRFRLNMFSAWMLTVLCGFAAASRTSAADNDKYCPNLLKAAGFENVEEASKIWNNLAEEKQFSITKEVKKSGSAALEWQNNDPNGKYVLCSQGVKLKKSRIYEIGAWIKTENLKGIRETGATICLGLGDKDGNYIKGGPHPGGLEGTQDWWHIKEYTLPLKEEVTTGSFCCYVRNRKDKIYTGKAWWDDVSVRLVPFFAQLHQPGIKRIITQPDYEIKVAATTWAEDFKNGFRQVAAKLELYNDKKKIIASKQLEITHKKQMLTMPVKNLANGIYRVKSSLIDKKSGDIIWSWDDEIICESPLKKRKVTIDSHRRLIDNGKPFLPIGAYWYSVKGMPKLPIDLFKDLSFNCVIPYKSYVLNKKDLDEAYAKKLRVIYSVKDHYTVIPYSPTAIKHPNDELKTIKREVFKWKKHPAIMAWYGNDERRLDAYHSHKSHYEFMNRYAPDHPVLSVDQLPGLTTSWHLFDIVGYDYYPVGPPDAELGQMANGISELVKVTGGKRAVWTIPQIFSYVSYPHPDDFVLRYPTLQEDRYMTWSSLAAGATGIIKYCVHTPHKDKNNDINKWKNRIRQCNTEVQQYAPVILSVEDTPKLKIKLSGKNSFWMVRKFENNIYLVVIGPEFKTGKIEAETNCGDFILERTELGGEQQTKTILQGLLKDKIAKQAIVIYKWKASEK